MKIVKLIFLGLSTAALLLISACKKSNDTPAPSQFPAVLDISAGFKYVSGSTFAKFSSSRFVILAETSKNLQQPEYITLPIIVNTAIEATENVQVTSQLVGTTDKPTYKSFGGINTIANELFWASTNLLSDKTSIINSGRLSSFGFSGKFSAKSLNKAVTFNHLLVLADGFLLTGTSEEAGSKKVFIIKFDNNASTIWYKSYFLTANNAGICAANLCDGNIGVIAQGANAGGDKDVYFLKVNNNGDSVLTAKVASPGNENPVQAITGDDCKVYITGNVDATGGGKNGFLMCVDNNGSLVWQDKYSAGVEAGLQSITLTPDKKKLIAAGYSKAGAGAMGKTFVVSVSTAGSELWRKVYGDDRFDATNVGILADASFYYLLSNREDAAGKHTAVFIKDEWK